MNNQVPDAWSREEGQGCLRYIVALLFGVAVSTTGFFFQETSGVLTLFVTSATGSGVAVAFLLLLAFVDSNERLGHARLRDALREWVMTWVAMLLLTLAYTAMLWGLWAGGSWLVRLLF
jgi:hypothetical protein